MQQFGTNACIGLRFEAYGNPFDRYIVASICPILNELSLDASTVQRSFQSELKAVLAQGLPAECVMYAEGIPEHVEDCGCDDIRVFLATEFMRQMKLPDYRSDPIDLRWRERCKGRRDRTNGI
jgi:hypothetical protein